MLQRFPSWLQLHDKSIAGTQQSVHRAAVQAQQAIRAEDVTFYQEIAKQAAQKHSTEGLSGSWKQVRAVLPKHRNKAQQVARDIDDDLLHHFETLEAGTEMPARAFFDERIQRNNRDLQARQHRSFLQLHELPTLAEVEALCLKQSLAQQHAWMQSQPNFVDLERRPSHHIYMQSFARN